LVFVKQTPQLHLVVALTLDDAKNVQVLLDQSIAFATKLLLLAMGFRPGNAVQKKLVPIEGLKVGASFEVIHNYLLQS
jgi:Fe2+ transport system protein FeoA